ncbi:MAG: LON peptidase substrate-binding domain-containing protein [Alphaproteobacteria bacterium]
MTATAFAPSNLPDEIPVFPLSGVILLPRARLPLNIFEPRYLAMVDDVLAKGRIIGMIQPSSLDVQDNQPPPLFNIGCAGRITSFNETEDGRFLIGLTGISRFALTEELPQDKPYRRARVSWQKFASDLSEPEDIEVDRKRLNSILQNYFKLQGIAADWNAVQNTTNEMLVSSLVMICPLAPNEKQALLEAPNVYARAEMLMALLEMASLPQSGEVEAGIKH